MPNVPQETQLEYLHRQISDRLTRLESSVEYYRYRHYRYQSSAVVLAALITILSGLKLPFLHGIVGDQLPALLTDVVLMLGAISTVVAAFGSFFSPQQSWYLNAEIYAKMRALEAKLEMDERSGTFSEREAIAVVEFYREYQSIMDDYNKRWQELRQKSK